jgi:hypothetical protein
MNKINSFTIFVVIVLLTGAALVACATSKAGSVVSLPDSKVEGFTYGEWMAKWWQYALVTPSGKNPISGNTGNNCEFQRIGDVGLLLANSTLAEPIECEVSSGMKLFVEVIGAECSTLEDAPFYGGNEEELLKCAQAFVTQDLKATIDGVEVKELEKYYFVSPLFEFTLPEDNILSVPEKVIPGGTTGKSIGSGSYLMINPLSAGKHTLYLRGTFPSLEYTAEKSINLTVSK